MVLTAINTVISTLLLRVDNIVSKLTDKQNLNFILYNHFNREIMDV
jgi:hypothetical protein